MLLIDTTEKARVVVKQAEVQWDMDNLKEMFVLHPGEGWESNKEFSWHNGDDILLQKTIDRPILSTFIEFYFMFSGFANSFSHMHTFFLLADATCIIKVRVKQKM